ncbi:coiled-coil domain-containing protein 69 isoform X2 [Clupea harengus]|uniref:Coiled-coil domain-containing protein 69 isoform X2 n=1 Tax=Clupea harengus TaxID=7950 RepID=A0A6P8H771_CLUHA|nr:coiled-coil domain-containing protein 69 isoform X2 [Clupea harengus]
MGCVQSKKSKSRVDDKKKSEANNSTQGGCAKVPLAELGGGVEQQLEQYEKQLKVLHALLAAPGGPERDTLFKSHQNGPLCKVVHNIAAKVKSETAAELSAAHQEEIRKTTEEYQSRTEETKRLHREEKVALNATHKAIENTLKEKMEELLVDLKVFHELRQRVEKSMLKRNLQRNIETHGSPGEFWEQEQESLLIVIEMKTERVQELGSKLLQMDTLVEKNHSLEDQVVHGLQQNEDLRVRIENYQSLIQQLSKDQHSLQEALERQSSEAQRLQQEKEELLFKLLHRDSCSSTSSFHLPPILSEVSPS